MFGFFKKESELEKAIGLSSELANECLLLIRKILSENQIVETDTRTINIVALALYLPLSASLSVTKATNGKKIINASFWNSYLDKFLLEIPGAATMNATQLGELKMKITNKMYEYAKIEWNMEPSPAGAMSFYVNLYNKFSDILVPTIPRTEGLGVKLNMALSLSGLAMACLAVRIPEDGWLTRS